MLSDKLFWFSQPSIVLSNYDNYFMWIFASLAILGILVKFASRLSKNVVVRKLVNRFGNSGLWMGIIGLLWFVMRYENTPIFAYRVWAGSVLIIFLIWIFYILKYMVTKFFSEKREFDKIQLNSKYIPGNRK